MMRHLHIFVEKPGITLMKLNSGKWIGITDLLIDLYGHLTKCHWITTSGLYENLSIWIES